MQAHVYQNLSNAEFAHLCDNESVKIKIGGNA